MSVDVQKLAEVLPPFRDTSPRREADACARCGEPSSTFSLFDLKQICTRCDDLEFQHPAHEQARAAFDRWALSDNATSVFKGVGVPTDLRTSLGHHVIVYSDPLCRAATLSTDRVLLAQNYAAAGSSLQCTEAELVERILRRKNQSGGVNYARHMHGAGVHRPAKAAARERVTALFKPSAWPGRLRILTMPGLRWSFERHLLDIRAVSGCKTEIYAVENDPAIFRASRRFMPGKEQVETGRECLAQSCPDGYRRSDLISGYFYQDVEDFLREIAPDELDAVWCDFTGELTRRRLNALRAFWRQGGCRVLAVTWLDARYKKPVADALASFCRPRRGKPQRTAADFLLDQLGPSTKELDRHRYADGFSPMWQLIVKR
jgi:hypothetical protein